jgi:hypothetical protein
MHAPLIGQHRHISPMKYLQNVLSDETVPAARRDRIAIAMLGVLVRQGGLSKKAIAEREAREAGNDPSSIWWDPEAGCSLLSPEWHNKRKDEPEARKRSDSCEELLGPRERAATD